jgi:hypothetical protein
MRRTWAVTKLVAIATLVSILATAPVGAFEVRPDKNLTGGSVRTGIAMSHVDTPKNTGVRCFLRGGMKF